MIKFTEHHEGRLTNKPLAPFISRSSETMKALKQWDDFIKLNRQVINLIVSQNTVDNAKAIATNWYIEVIGLGKVFYSVLETTDQVYNSYTMLIEDIETGNLAAIERTYITTFTNVAKYQVRK